MCAGGGGGGGGGEGGRGWTMILLDLYVFL